MKRKILYIGNKLANKEFTPTGIDTLGTKLEREGYELRYASSKRLKVLRLLEMVSQIIKNKNWADYVLIDTYSTQNFWFAYASGRLCSFFGLRYVPILHGGNLPERLKVSPKASRKLFDHSYKNVAPSLYLKEFFENYGYQVVHIPNAIEVDLYSFKKRTSIQPKLLWVRSFAELYNPMLALQIIERLMPEFPNAKLCMVGPDKDGSLAICKSYAENNRLPVTFTGKLSRSEWTKLSEDYDIFINTTHFDNFPVSVLEAMALGLPVISTNVGGLPYLITNNLNGFLVADDDLESFVEKIKNLVCENQLSTEICKNALSLIDKFSWGFVKTQWFKVLR